MPGTRYAAVNPIGLPELNAPDWGMDVGEKKRRLPGSPMEQSMKVINKHFETVFVEITKKLEVKLEELVLLGVEKCLKNFEALDKLGGARCASKPHVNPASSEAQPFAKMSDFQGLKEEVEKLKMTLGEVPRSLKDFEETNIQLKGFINTISDDINSRISKISVDIDEKIGVISSKISVDINKIDEKIDEKIGVINSGIFDYTKSVQTWSEEIDKRVEAIEAIEAIAKALEDDKAREDVKAREGR